MAAAARRLLQTTSSPFIQFNGYCRDDDGVDVLGDAAPSGSASRAQCEAVCSADDACTAYEWYATTPGYQNVKCHVFPGTPGSGGSSSNPPTQGGGTYLDAVCYVKELTTACTSVCKGSSFCYYPSNCKSGLSASGTYM
eukprot:gene56819-biopygen68695